MLSNIPLLTIGYWNMYSNNGNNDFFCQFLGELLNVAIFHFMLLPFHRRKLLSWLECNHFAHYNCFLASLLPLISHWPQVVAKEFTLPFHLIPGRYGRQWVKKMREERGINHRWNIYVLYFLTHLNRHTSSSQSRCMCLNESCKSLNESKSSLPASHSRLRR